MLIVAGGLGFAYRLPSLVKGLEIWLSIAPMMGIAFWMGLLWRRTTVAGAWASAIAGFAVWALAVQAPVVAWAGGLPYADALLTSLELEVPMPSRTSMVGFAAGWLMVGLLLGGFAWYVGG